MECDSEKAKLLIETAGVYNRVLSDDVVIKMLRGLRDVSLSDLEWATDEMIRTSRFMPTVATLRELLENKKETEADEEYGKRIWEAAQSIEEEPDEEFDEFCAPQSERDENEG